MSTGRIAALLVAGLSLPGWGYAQGQSQKCFQVTSRQVAQTLSSRGIQVADSQVSLLANVVAAEPDPVLDVLAVEQRGQRASASHPEASYMIKLGCHSEGACLPFYAMVNRTDEGLGPAIGAFRNIGAAGSTAPKPGGAITIRAGAHAMLVMGDGSIQIEVAVVSLENGIAGHRIHVASPDRKQVYLAEVVSATLLTRSF